jgi:hypothetical protein
VTAVVLAFSVLPEELLHTRWFAVLSSFVAVNTILYVSLSIFKIAPKLYLSDLVKKHGRRSQTRSIYPNGRCAPDDYRPVPNSLAVNGPMGGARAVGHLANRRLQT